MKISKEGIAITKRFFEAVDMLKAQRRIRGLKTAQYNSYQYSKCEKKSRP